MKPIPAKVFAKDPDSEPTENKTRRQARNKRKQERGKFNESPYSDGLKRPFAFVDLTEEQVRKLKGKRLRKYKAKKRAA